MPKTEGTNTTLLDALHTNDSGVIVGSCVHKWPALSALIRNHLHFAQAAGYLASCMPYQPLHLSLVVAACAVDDNTSGGRRTKAKQEILLRAVKAQARPLPCELLAKFEVAEQSGKPPFAAFDKHFVTALTKAVQNAAPAQTDTPHSARVLRGAVTMGQ